MKRKIKKAVQGSISLFLVVLMLPFAEIVGILVEANRYHSCMSLVDEMIGSAEFSTLANYDTYLKKRFGLYALTQQKDKTELFDFYLQENLKTLPNSVAVTQAKMEGYYNLSDEEILKKQMLEYSKFTVPTKLLADFSNLESLLKIFEGMEMFESVVKMLTSFLDVLKALLKLVNKLLELIADIVSVHFKANDYQKSFNKFNDAAKEYYAKLQELNAKKAERKAAESEWHDAESAASQKSDAVTNKDKEISDLQTQINNTTDPDEKERLEAQKQVLQNEYNTLQEEYDDADDESKDAYNKYRDLDDKCKTLEGELSQKESTLSDRKNDYMDDIDSLKSALDDLTESVNGAVDEVASFAQDIANSSIDLYQNMASVEKADANKKIKENEKRIKELEGQIFEDMDQQEWFAKKAKISELQDQNAKIKSANAMTDAFQNGFNSIIADTQHELESFKEVQNIIDALDKNYTNCQKFDPKTQTSASGVNESTFHTYTNSEIKDNARKDTFQSIIDQITDKLNNQDLVQLMQGLVKVVTSMFSTNIFTDPDLHAMIDENHFSQYGLNIKDIDSQNAMTHLIYSYVQPILSIIELVEHWSDYDLVKKIEKSIDCVSAILEPYRALANIAVQYISNIVQFVKNTFNGTWYESLYINGYLAYMLPDRTCYDSGKNITGTFSFGGIPYAENKTVSIPILSSLENVAKAVVTFSSGKGTEKMFMGAELEYLFGATHSEAMNQILTFGTLYLFRMLLDIGPIFANAEVEEIATTLGACTFGVGMVIVYIIEILGEPFLDTFFLVNGAEVSLVKQTIFLTPSGIPLIISNLGKVINLTPKQKNKITQESRQKIADTCNKAGSDIKVRVKNTQPSSNDVSVGSKTSDIFDFSALLNMDYRNHLLLLMLGLSDYKKEIKLFRNLVQMEAESYYSKKAGGVFDVREAYSFLQVTAKAEIRNAIPGGELVDFSLLTRDRTVMRGY